jgi:sugar O-acyltransferase (sialic acid O-acetyltransferase NeuD family)
MMGSRLILLGGGGHCRSILSSLNRELYDDIIIADKAELIGQSIDGIKVEATDEDLPRLFSQGYTQAFLAIGCVKADSFRRILAGRLKSIGYELPSIIDGSAVTAKSALIGEGVFLGKNSVVNAGSLIGSCAIINTGSIIEHDCRIGSFVHMAPGTVASGHVEVGDDSFIGAGSCIKQDIKIGEHTTIGMGSVILRDMPSYSVAYGNPCRVVGKNE